MKKYGHFFAVHGPGGPIRMPLHRVGAGRHVFRPGRSTCNRSTRWRPSVSTATPRRGMMSHGLIPWILDEVRVGIGTPAIITISKVFGDVDSGETWSFAPDQSCIGSMGGRRPWRVRRTRINLDLLARRNSRPDQLHGRDGRGRQRLHPRGLSREYVLLARSHTA